ITGKPIKFIGMGEKSDALEPFHPDRIASRILGMGDVLGLLDQAEHVAHAQDSRRNTVRVERLERIALLAHTDE
ncbi:hypothetical protein QCD79_33115, partial [Pseudomonas quasicaspiana]|nr:hypothetical protein [Pseudomonas quasicaspiana]